MTKIPDLLIRLLKVYRAYQKGDEPMKARLLSASDTLIRELMSVGYPRDFLEALLMYGEEFVTGDVSDFGVFSDLLTLAERVFTGEWLVIKMAELTGREGYQSASFWSFKSGYGYGQTLRFLGKWVGNGLLQYKEGADMFAASLATRAKYGFAPVQ